jgi:hypothetical protein
MVFGNLTVALAVSLFQVIALMGASVVRGSTFLSGVSRATASSITKGTGSTTSGA